MSQDLIVLENITAVDVYQKKDGVATLLAKIEADIKANLVDISTEEGRAACKSFAYKIARSKTLLDDMGKELTEEWKAKSKVVDNDRKIIRDKLDALKEEYRRPLTEWETLEEHRVKTITERIDRMIEFGKIVQNWQVISVRELEDHLAATIDDNFDYCEFQDRADEVRGVTVIMIKDSIDKRTQYDRDQAELKALRDAEEARQRKEREDQIAAKAKADAEAKAAADIKAAEDRAADAIRQMQVEQDRIERESKEASAKAEQDRKDAEAKAQKAAKDASDKAERDQAEAVRKERERIEKEAADRKALDDKRAADQAHRAVVHNKAVYALSDAGIDERIAHQIVELIEANKIPNVTINY